MKVMHVSIGDFSGGAARAAYRIHRALSEYGVDSCMRVLFAETGDVRVVGNKEKPLIAQLIQNLYRYWLQKGFISDNTTIHTFGQISAGLVDELNASDADILNLHWISDMLSISDIGRLKKPIVWTLHDMWPFCGGEHYVPEDSTARFRQGYRIDNRPIGESGPDLNLKAWEAKRQLWEKLRFTIVGNSYWMAECAKHSALFANSHVCTIHYPLETNDLWFPMPREAARTALRLPIGKKLIMMGAFGGVADPRKGGDLLREALTRLSEQWHDDFEIVIFGQARPKYVENWGRPVNWLGEICDDRKLAQAYSAVDVMVVPSRQEAFGQTASEAHACGTPVVAFNIGGLPDIVEHKVTGYLARPFETADLANGILWVLSDEERRLNLSAAARDSVVRKFSEPKIAKAYSDLYNKVLTDS